MQPAQRPHLFGSYEIQEELGRGYSGVVYQARHTITGEIVALKILQEPPGIPNAARQERFQREARSLSAVSHPAIPRVLESGNLDGYLFIVREFFPGRTLREILDEQKMLPEIETVRIISELLSALAALHAQGIIHRDLKPENIILQDDGAVRILDLGAAHDAMETGLTQTGEMIGTPAYMSPEQIRGTAVDARSDLFASAILLHEILTGGRPFVAKRAIDMLRAIEQDEPRIAPSIPPALRSVLSVALAKKPGERFASAEQMQAALEGIWPKNLRRPDALPYTPNTNEWLRVTASALRVAFPLLVLAVLFGFAFFTLQRFLVVARKSDKAAKAAAAKSAARTARSKGGGHTNGVSRNARSSTRQNDDVGTFPTESRSASYSYPSSPRSQSVREVGFAPASSSRSTRKNSNASPAQPRRTDISAAVPAPTTCTACGGTGHHADQTCGGTGKCQECGGNGQKAELCFDCNGAGTARCYMCEGTGVRKILNKTCETCGGSGKAKCITCGGHGHRKCLVCAGSGKCPSCNGRGQEKCDTCSGKGTVLL